MGSSRSARCCRSPHRPTTPMPPSGRDPAKLSARAQRDTALKPEIRRVFAENFHVYGVRKVWRQLRARGLRRRPLHRRAADAEHGPARRHPRQAGRTTVSDKAAPCPLDHVNRQFQAPAPNRLWVSDFTYVATWTGFVYVAFVIDAYARRIVGWRVSAPPMPASCSMPWSRHCTNAGPSIAAGSCTIATAGSQGGFKWSSQHHDRWRVAMRTGRGARIGSGVPYCAVAWPTAVARREEPRRFWAAIAAGVSSEDAAIGAGVSQPVGSRWFREAGGMPPSTLSAIGKAAVGAVSVVCGARGDRDSAGTGPQVREIARQLGRAASTISRELRRNAATRSGGLEYRATTAQWHAERAARRPKPAKLAMNAEAAALCAGSAVRPGRSAERRRGCRARRCRGRTPARAAAASAMGDGMEPGADCPAPSARLPG